MKLIFNNIFNDEFNYYIRCSKPLIYSVPADSLSNYLFDIEGVQIAEWAIKILNDSKLTHGDVSLRVWGAEIDRDNVWLEYMFFDSETEEYDETDSFSCRVCINRQEMIYAVTKWRDFLQRPIDPDYQEIIDTEDCYLNQNG